MTSAVKDLEFDITSRSPLLRHKVKEIPLAGAWGVELDKDQDTLGFTLEYGEELPEALFGQAVRTSLRLSWVDGGGASTTIGEESSVEPLPRRDPGDGQPFTGRTLLLKERLYIEVAARSDGKYDPLTRRRYRFEVTMKTEYPKDLAATYAASTEQVAMRVSGLHLEQAPQDVRLFFPNAHSDGAELWIKSDVLRKSSPWFKDLLDSDFAESVPRRSKRARKSATPDIAAPKLEKDFADSDDETDEFLFSKRPPQVDSSSAADELSYRQITIPQTAFSTYHALIVYLTTGYISFTALASSFPTSDSKTRLDFLSSAYDANPTLPLPVSLKSLYRLTHLLSLDDLQKKSLDAVRSSLTPDNAAVELFTDAAIAYDELRKVILTFVKENWAKVKESQGWKDVSSSIEAGEQLERAPVLMELFRAVKDA